MKKVDTPIKMSTIPTVKIWAVTLYLCVLIWLSLSGLLMWVRGRKAKVMHLVGEAGIGAIWVCEKQRMEDKFNTPSPVYLRAISIGEELPITLVEKGTAAYTTIKIRHLDNLLYHLRPFFYLNKDRRRSLSAVDIAIAE